MASSSIVRRPLADFHGAGPSRPFRRQARDFTFKSGPALVLANVAQILGTDAAGVGPDQVPIQGELPWDDEKGSRLYLLHHDNVDDDLTQFAHSLIEEALVQEPRFRLKDVVATKDPAGRAVYLRILGDVVSASGREVILAAAQLEVEI